MCVPASANCRIFTFADCQSVSSLRWIKKSTVIQFASLKHAFMYRMIRFPVISPSGAVASDDVLQITAEDAMMFMKQFEPDGVFSSWASILQYCNIAKITKIQRVCTI